MRKINFFLLLATALLVSSGMWADDVAQIGGTGYATLQEAINAVPTDGTQTTITMIGDIAQESNGSIATINGARDIILNLNNHSISLSSSNPGSSTFGIKVEDAAKLTIDDYSEGQGGSIIATTTATTFNAYPMTIIVNGQLTVNKGIIKCFANEAYARYAIDVTGRNSTCTINGGEITSIGSNGNYYNPAIRLYYFDAGQTGSLITLNINGGIIKGQRAVYMQGGHNETGITVNVTGGQLFGYKKGTANEPERVIDSQCYGTTQNSVYKNIKINISGTPECTPEFTGYVYLGDADNHTTTHIGAEEFNCSGGTFLSHNGIRSLHQPSDFDETSSEEWLKSDRTLRTITGGTFRFDKTGVAETNVVSSIQFADDSSLDYAVTADGFTKFTGDLAHKTTWENAGYKVVTIDTPSGKSGTWYRIYKETFSVTDFDDFRAFVADGHVAKVIQEDEQSKTVQVVPVTNVQPTQTGNWEASATWGGSNVPDETAAVTIPNNVSVTIPDGIEASAYSVQTEGDGSLTVEAGGSLEVGAGGVPAASTILIQNDAEASGIYKVDPNASDETAERIATVDVYTRAYMTATTQHWQQFACPVKGNISITTSLPDNFPAGDMLTAIYSWEYGSQSQPSHWELERQFGVAGLSGEDAAFLTPFAAYDLINQSRPQDGGVTYQFTGELVGNKDMKLNFPEHGFCVFGNSYTAPIDLETFFADVMAENNNVDACVYIFNSAKDRFEQVNALQLVINKIVAGYAPFTEIPPLQAFTMNLTSGNSATSTVDYANSVWGVHSSGNPILAPARVEDIPFTAIAKIIVSDGTNEDEVMLIEGEEYSAEYDLGADAEKYMNSTINLYANAEAGNLAMVATDNLMGTTLSFQSGEAIAYNMTFANVMGEYNLIDHITNSVVAISEGGSYSFIANANATNEGRFEIVGRNQMPTNVENTENINNVKGIYTILGMYVGETCEWNSLPAGVYVVDGVKLVK